MADPTPQTTDAAATWGQTTHARRLELALRATYAAGWPFYDLATRERLAADHTRLNMPSILEALRRAGLKLEDADAQP